MNREFIVKTWPCVGKDGKVYREGGSSAVSAVGLTREEAVRMRQELDERDVANGFGINEEEYADFLRGLESLPWRDQLEFDFGQRIEDRAKAVAE